ncbi:aminotransferase class V-fold PLP-dependent enzyme, partial [Massilia arenosa]
RARRVLGAPGGRLMFTSGATEGIQTAILSALAAIRERRTAGETTGTLLLYGATEHKAVPEALAHWNRLLGTGLELRPLPVDDQGRHRLDVLRELAPQTALVCTMAANNETGVISDLDGIAAVLTELAPRALWMVDCVQALGKLPLKLGQSRIDYAPFSGHKLYAPKGIGMLYVREGAPFTPLMMGGGQEGGQRSGTENMAGIAAFGAVLEALEQGGTFRTHDELANMRARVAAALQEALPGILFNAPFEYALPTTINFSVPGVTSRELLELFDAAGVRVSSGSACSAAKAAPSHVLDAMGLPAWRSGAAVRLSYGPAVDDAFIDDACARIRHCGQALRDCGMLSDSARADAPAAVVQLNADGACTWLVRDAAAHVVIDPLPQLVPRIAALVRGGRAPLRAIVATHAYEGFEQARDALSRALAGLLYRAESSDALGWPDASESVTLSGGAVVHAVSMGTLVLARVPRIDGVLDGTGYLVGPRSDAGLAADHVRYAFTGPALLPGGLAAHLPVPRLRAAARELATIMHGQTILCASRIAGAPPVTTLAAEARKPDALAEQLRAQPRLAGDAVPPMDALAHLDGAVLGHFLATHPDAQLVDVREPHETLAGAVPAWHGRQPVHVPLSQLAAQLPHWLSGPARPLVFFCRSGNRSAQAAQCLHRLGYRNAWQLTGGLALAGTIVAEGDDHPLAA